MYVPCPLGACCMWMDFQEKLVSEPLSRWGCCLVIIFSLKMEQQATLLIKACCNSIVARQMPKGARQGHCLPPSNSLILPYLFMMV